MENTAEMVQGEGINRVDSISDLELTSVSSTVSSIFSTDDLLSSSSSGDVSTFSSAGGSGEMLPATAMSRVLRLKCVGRNNKGVTWGVTSVIGRRKEMEDVVRIIPGFVSCTCDSVGGCTAPGSRTSGEVSPVHYFGVYDGHGGSQVAQFCEKRMHEVVAEELDREAVDAHHWRRKWEAALCRSFERADNEFSIEAPSLEMVGSAAVVVILSGCQIIASNCGDSRAVLCRAADTIALTIDQKPDREDELLRIEGQGGKVINWNGARVLGVLAMSRAIVKNDGETALTLAKSLHMISGVYLNRMKCFNAALSKSLMENFVQLKSLKRKHDGFVDDASAATVRDAVILLGLSETWSQNSLNYIFNISSTTILRYVHSVETSTLMFLYNQSGSFINPGERHKRKRRESSAFGTNECFVRK